LLFLPQIVLVMMTILQAVAAVIIDGMRHSRSRPPPQTMMMVVLQPTPMTAKEMKRMIMTMTAKDDDETPAHLVMKALPMTALVPAEDQRRPTTTCHAKYDLSRQRFKKGSHH